jgi:hypothetical protein
VTPPPATGAAAAAGPAKAPAPRRTPGASRPVGARPRLTVVPPIHAGVPRAPFVLLVGALLTAGLAGLLFLHTALAEDSFRVHDLTERSAVLTDREQALAQEIAEVASPARLSVRAAALGMVRSENPAFIRISDGKILGRPRAGQAPPPKPHPSASPAAASSSAPSGTASAAPAPDPSGTGR